MTPVATADPSANLTPTVDSVAAYLPLARLALGEPEHPWLRPLAELLEAASRGVGSLPAPTFTNPPPQHAIVIDGQQMLLARTAAAWQVVRADLEQRLARPALRHDHAAVREQLDRILPAAQECDEQGQVVVDNAHQRLSAALLVDAPVGVLTGGPGTGKTTSAAALIAVALALKPDLTANDLLICAPTGKAANRLRQSLHGASTRLHLSERERSIITALRPQTMHRSLGWSPKPPEDGGPWLHNQRRPLPQRLVIIDEASMADVALLAALIRALPTESQLLILGDRDQLDSVEAGGVLSELVQRGSAGDLTPEHQQLLRARCGDDAPRQWRTGLPVLPPLETGSRSPLPGLVAGLSLSYRAKSAPWILRLAELTRPGSPHASTAFQQCMNAEADEHLLSLPQQSATDRHTSHHWLRLAQTAAAWSLQHPPEERALVKALGEHQLITGTNTQTRRANALGQHLLERAGSSPDPAQPPELPLLGRDAHYAGPLLHGTPIMVLANDRSLDLANGDIGLALGPGPGQGATVVCFPNIPQPLPLARLPRYASAHAITIHKSQGSEWRQVTIDLPTHAGDLLDRRLLYTAITRSSYHLAIHARQSSLDQILKIS